MPDHFFLVLSEPPAGLPEGEYERWYDVHMREVLELPGFVSAERSALRFIRSSTGEGVPYSYLVQYGIDGELEDAMRALRAAVDGGGMTFPDWYPGVVSAGFERVPA